jgi:hypothetical protein
LKLSRNRWAAIYYLILATMPIGILVVMLQFSTPAELWAARSITWLPIKMVFLACAELALAIACFPDRSRQQSLWLVLLMAGLALAIACAYLLSWVPALFHLLPCWLLWRSYREASGQRQAA